MTVTYSGDSITYSDLSTQSSAQVGFKNRIINGGFTYNQRVQVSGVALTAGVYGHDRFKAGAGGCTYTFVQGLEGVNTTVTITAGTLVQIIEGCNVVDSGTYVLSWTGTAQGRLNGGTYGTSGTVTVTGWVPGTNLPVEFGLGTVGSVQLERGGKATSFDYRDHGGELRLCQHYTYAPAGGSNWIAYTYAGGAGAQFSIPFPVPMRTTPTYTLVGVGASFYSQVNNPVVSAVIFIPSGSTSSQAVVDFQIAANASNFCGRAAFGATQYPIFSAEL